MESLNPTDIKHNLKFVPAAKDLLALQRNGFDRFIEAKKRSRSGKRILKPSTPG